MLLDSIVNSNRWKLMDTAAEAWARLPVWLRASIIDLNRRLRLRRSRAEQEQEAAFGRLRGELFEKVRTITPTLPMPVDLARPAGEQPPVSVVAPLYNDAATLEPFLRALRGQSYAGCVGVVLVDDASADDSAARARELGRQLGDEGRFTVEVLQNASNLGNCRSRNAGIAAAKGDILFVIDADCIVNRDFIAAHVAEHGRGADVVIGPMGIEAGAGRVETMLTMLQADREFVRRHMHLQDPTNLASAVNCVTRNFSVTRAAVARLGRELFDDRFSYRHAPDTGFGWEDVEMGAALERSGARIGFTWEALSVHISHASTAGEATKALGSARNFALLLTLHPELEEHSPEWLARTAGAIRHWLERCGQRPPAAFAELEAHLGRTGRRNGDIVVYTAVAGGYDRVAAAPAGSVFRHVLFGDSDESTAGWDFVPLAPIADDPVRRAKHPKILPHRYFAGSGWSVWTDGNIRLLADPSVLVAEVAGAGHSIGVFRHPVRDCLYDEARLCLLAGRDSNALIVEQMARYRAAGYPAGNGLAECNVLVRRHDDPAVMAAMDAWWAEIEAGSRRDQLSFNYVLWKSGLAYHELGGGRLDARRDPRFAYAPHARDPGWAAALARPFRRRSPAP